MNSKLLSSCAPLSLTFEGNSAIESDVSFLNEIGLDPGLDHLMAIKLHKESQSQRLNVSISESEKLGLNLRD